VTEIWTDVAKAQFGAQHEPPRDVQDRQALEAAGWKESGQWWLPPNGVTYKAKCYSLREALAAERVHRNGRGSE